MGRSSRLIGPITLLNHHPGLISPILDFLPITYCHPTMVISKYGFLHNDLEINFSALGHWWQNSNPKCRFKPSKKIVPDCVERPVQIQFNGCKFRTLTDLNIEPCFAIFAIDLGFGFVQIFVPDILNGAFTLKFGRNQHNSDEP